MRLLTVLCLLLFTALLSAQFDEVSIETTHVSGAVYMLEGYGGNLAVMTGEDGVLLVDDQYAPLTDRILAAIPAAGADSHPRWMRYRLAGGLTIAAASVALALILPNLPQDSGPQPTWTDLEIAAAREEVMFSLALTARVLDRTQKHTVIEVFANQLPNSVNESLKIVKPTTSGGNG